jgi:hypothetical protein
VFRLDVDLCGSTRLARGPFKTVARRELLRASLLKLREVAES